MLRHTIRGLSARRLRVLLTGVAVLLGVGLVSGTLVLADTTRAELEQSLAGATEGIDVQVRPDAAALPGAGKGGGGVAGVPPSLLGRVAAVPGVAHATATVTGYAQLLGRDGRPAGPGEPLGSSVGPSLAADLTAGHAPGGPSEVVIDQASADREGFGVGDRVQVVTAGGSPRAFTVAGILDTPRLGDVTLAGFDLPTAQRLLDRQGELDTIDVRAAGGVDQATLRDRVAAALGPGVEAVTGQALAAERAADLQDELSSVSTLVLLFGLVALLLGAFVIHNTFSILVAQRTRELALLRCLGASRRQLRNSVLVESLVVGAVAAAAGLLFGTAVAAALRALLASTSGLRALGSLPRHAPVLAPRTAVVALAVGTVVTALSALAPARRATRVPPVAALREEPAIPDHRGRRAGPGAVAGALLGLGGVGVVLAGMPADTAGFFVGGGAVLLLLGLRLAGPVLARELGRVLGLPVARARGLPGRLARQNAMRNPRRTAATALTLTMGVGMLSVITILAASTKAAAEAAFDRTDRADFELRIGGGDLPPPMSPVVATRLRALPELAEVRSLPAAGVGGTPGAVAGADPGRGPRWVLARAAAGVSPAAARAAVDRALAGFPTVRVTDRADRRRAAAGRIDPALRLYLALTGLATVIGLLGIVNTLALSVVERARELGLLRAIGMDGRQVRSMVRWEAVIVTLVGTVLGLATGGFLGWALTRALEDSSSPTRFTLPVAWLAASAVLAGAAGVLAAVPPARRASRVDVLRAVAAG